MNFKKIGVITIFATFIGMLLNCNIFYDKYILNNRAFYERIGYFTDISLLIIAAWLMIRVLSNCVTRPELKKKETEIKEYLIFEYVSKNELKTILHDQTNSISAILNEKIVSLNKQFDTILKIITK